MTGSSSQLSKRRMTGSAASGYQSFADHRETTTNQAISSIENTAR